MSALDVHVSNDAYSEVSDSDSAAEKKIETEGGICLGQAWVIVMNIIIGIGILGIPYCFKTGLFMNALIVLFIAAFAYLSFVLLIDASLTSA
jgi:uncharacterized membrane protein